MNVQIFTYGACIRLVTDGSVLTLTKAQVKSIQVIRQDTVRISIGEGPLDEILVKLSDVTQPAGLVDVNALRDAIAHLLDYANQYEQEALLKQQLQIDELIAIKQLFNLWHSSLQIDLNFQQLQVNGLVAINNRLLETKENNEQLLSNQREQTAEIKNHGGTLTGIKSVLEVVKSLDETVIGKLTSIDTTVTATRGLTGTIISLQGEQMTELQAQNTSLTRITALLAQMKTTDEDSLAKLDNIANVLIEHNVRQFEVLARLDGILSALGSLHPPTTP